MLLRKASLLQKSPHDSKTKNNTIMTIKVDTEPLNKLHTNHNNLYMLSHHPTLNIRHMLNQDYRRHLTLPLFWHHFFRLRSYFAPTIFRCDYSTPSSPPQSYSSQFLYWYFQLPRQLLGGKSAIKQLTCLSTTNVITRICDKRFSTVNTPLYGSHKGENYNEHATL